VYVCMQLLVCLGACGAVGAGSTRVMVASGPVCVCVCVCVCMYVRECRPGPEERLSYRERRWAGVFRPGRQAGGRADGSGRGQASR
jgi:hypothetical protein